MRQVEEVLQSKRLQRWVTAQGHQLTVGVVSSDGRFVWTNGAGGASQADGHYEIGSITKTLTGLLLASGGEKALWSPSDRLSALAPGLAESTYAQQTTLLQLVTHTANIPRIPRNLTRTVQDKLNPYANYTEQDLIEAVMTEIPKTGVKHEYSNYGFGLLGWLLSKRLGKSLQDAMNELVFQPLRLSNTALAGHYQAPASLLPVYNGKGKPVPHWTFQDATAGAGAGVSTISDMLTYTEAHLGLSSPSSLDNALAECRKEHYGIFPSRGIGIGYGWMFYREKDGSVTHWHNGGTYGSSSFMAFNRDKSAGLVILSNRGADLASSLPLLGIGRMNVDRLARILANKLFV